MSPAELHALRSAAVPLIQDHLWLSKVPPRSLDAKPWTIGRELSIWNLLVAANFEPEHINGAITVVRTLRRDWDGQPLRMSVFYWKRQGGFCATPFLEQCIGYYLTRRARKEYATTPMLPSVRAVLRRVIDGPGSDTVTGKQREAI